MDALKGLDPLNACHDSLFKEHRFIPPTFQIKISAILQIIKFICITCLCFQNDDWLQAVLAVYLPDKFLISLYTGARSHQDHIGFVCLDNMPGFFKSADLAQGIVPLCATGDGLLQLIEVGATFANEESGNFGHMM